jgi:hypothetical protein
MKEFSDLRYHEDEEDDFAVTRWGSMPCIFKAVITLKLMWTFSAACSPHPTHRCLLERRHKP